MSSVIFLQHHNFLFAVLVSALLFCAVVVVLTKHLGFLNHGKTGSANGFGATGAVAAFHPRPAGAEGAGGPGPSAREAPPRGPGGSAPVAMEPPLPWSPRSRGGGGRCGPAPGDVSAAEDGGGAAPVPAACPRSAALRGPSAPRAPAALSAGTAAAPLPAPRAAMSCSADAVKEKLLWNVKKEVSEQRGGQSPACRRSGRRRSRPREGCGAWGRRPGLLRRVRAGSAGSNLRAVDSVNLWP